ncbi:MAG: aminotransferase class V-fold PLP-dependent enzyme [Pseudomonadota bacterium]
MFHTKPGLMGEIRSRFAHVSACPIEGDRIFFENAGGALTLNSVVETSAKFAALPDNQGRDNPMSKHLMAIIAKAKTDTMTFLNVDHGQVFVGESGTELLFRLISTAVLGAGGEVVGTTLEHPASRSAAQRWAEVAGVEYIAVPHDNETGVVTAQDYAAVVTANTRVATIIHTSPVTGMGVDLAAITTAIREKSPHCFIIVDGIQHAAHGHVDLTAAPVDGYVMSAYKVFSRHGYGVCWVSDRLTALPHNNLKGGPEQNWEMGTRDTGAYATFSDVIDYLKWLGTHFTESTDDREKLEAAASAIHAHEKSLTDAMVDGTGNHRGLRHMEKVSIIGGADNPHREGLVSLTVEGVDAPDVVERLRHKGIRVHTRKADHYSGNVLEPLGLTGCIRVSLCHYNTVEEVADFLEAMETIAG